MSLMVSIELNFSVDLLAANKMTPPLLRKNTSEGIGQHKTCTSFLVYLPPMDDPTTATERFVDIYSEKGRILC